MRLVLPIIKIHYNKTKCFTKPEIFNFISGRSIQLIVTDVPQGTCLVSPTFFYSKNVFNIVFTEDIFVKKRS